MFPPDVSKSSEVQALTAANDNLDASIGQSACSDGSQAAANDTRAAKLKIEALDAALEHIRSHSAAQLPLHDPGSTLQLSIKTVLYQIL
jgi:hypothetical protein